MAKRNPYVAAVLGFLIYPLGYFYVGRFWRGLAVFFLVPLLLTPFMGEGDFLPVNMSANYSSNSSISPLPGGLNESALLEEVVASYTGNPQLLVMDVFLRFVIALDCFLIAKRVKNPSEKKDKPKPLVRVKSGTPTQGEPYYTINADVKCPRCKVGLAMASKRCPNCGAELTPPSLKPRE